MDNLTHSLVGALLGQMGLKRKTGLAMPTLIIAANIPDIDAVAVLLGGHQHLALRRGITHGPIAMVILPLLLWGAMLWFDAWQTRRGKRPEKRLPVHKGWLLALAYIGCLSHPLFDWFNSYGVRLLEPFSSQWFYGDTLFIIDVWIWVALIAGVWLSLRREHGGNANWQRPAVLSTLFLMLYIGINTVISGLARQTVEFSYQWERNANLVQIVSNPVPFAFWKRDVLWRDTKSFGTYRYSLFDARNYIGHSENKIASSGPIGLDSNLVDKQFELSSDADAFLFWSRMPIIDQSGEYTWIGDQRFTDPLVRDRFRVKVKDVK
jgi:inner membrane protein